MIMSDRPTLFKFQIIDLAMSCFAFAAADVFVRCSMWNQFSIRRSFRFVIGVVVLICLQKRFKYTMKIKNRPPMNELDYEMMNAPMIKWLQRKFEISNYQNEIHLMSMTETIPIQNDVTNINTVQSIFYHFSIDVCWSAVVLS